MRCINTPRDRQHEGLELVPMTFRATKIGQTIQRHCRFTTMDLANINATSSYIEIRSDGIGLTNSAINLSFCMLAGCNIYCGWPDCFAASR